MEQELRRGSRVRKGEDDEADRGQVEHHLNGSRVGAQRRERSVDGVPPPMDAVVRDGLEPIRGSAGNLGQSRPRVRGSGQDAPREWPLPSIEAIAISTDATQPRWP